MSSPLNREVIKALSKATNEHYKNENDGYLEELFEIIFDTYKEELLDVIKQAGYKVELVNLENNNEKEISRV